MERRNQLERHRAERTDAAKFTSFTTTFGKRMCLYDDLYTVPEDPEEAYYADMGIHSTSRTFLIFSEVGRTQGNLFWQLTDRQNIKNG